MYTKHDFIRAVAHETKICQHLHGKLSEAALSYRPAAGARSTLELLQYLTYCASGPVEALVKGDWSLIAGLREEANTLTLAEFPARMETQRSRVSRVVEGLTESDLGRPAQLPWGVTTTLGAGLVDTALRFLSAYRLQLFNNIKACGHPELSTHDAWRGQSAPTKSA
ncbi:MAG: hypothetical protein AB7O52_19555 [Planctomycetota bacterium]